jgi:hypothetical protein
MCYNIDNVWQFKVHYIRTGILKLVPSLKFMAGQHEAGAVWPTVKHLSLYLRNWRDGKLIGTKEER